MKRFKSKSKNAAYLGYRIIAPVIDPIRFIKGLAGYIWYIRDLMKFKALDNKENIELIDLFPILHEKTRQTSIDAHYFHQQIWLFGNVLQRKPESHVDIGSTYQMSGYLSKVVPATFIDIRPVDLKLENLTLKEGSIMALPYEDNTLESVSCLSVIEHIGLGRYGDKVDPDGWKKACKELQRVLAKNGRLYISVPIGKTRICFNAHRVFSPESMIDALDGLKLLEFSSVDDAGNYLNTAKPSDYKDSEYSLGMYIFEKDAVK